jgi:hypothetical protein
MNRQNPRSPEFWTATFTGILALVTLFAVVVGYKQLRDFRAESQVQHLLALEEKFDRDPMLTYRRALAEKRLKKQEDPDEVYPILDFFETVGLLVRRGYLDESDVWNTFSYPVFALNADARQIIEQDQRDDPTTYAEFVGLVKRLERIEAENHGTAAHPSSEEIEDYWKQELIGSTIPVAPRTRRMTKSK